MPLDGDTVKEYCLGLHEVVGRNFDVAEVFSLSRFWSLSADGVRAVASSWKSVCVVVWALQLSAFA